MKGIVCEEAKSSSSKAITRSDENETDRDQPMTRLQRAAHVVDLIQRDIPGMFDILLLLPIPRWLYKVSLSATITHPHPHENIASRLGG